MNISKHQVEMGRRLRKYRKLAKASAKQAAEIAEMSDRTLRRIESGDAEIGVARLYTLCRAYRVPFGEVAFGGKTPLLDISMLWPHTQDAIRQHIARLLVAQQMVESHWPQTLERIRKGVNVDPPWQ